MARLIGVITCCVMLAQLSALPTSARSDSAAAFDGKPHVKVLKIGSFAETASLGGMGSLSCPRSVELGFDDAGVISEMQVEEGDRVEKGDVLAKLEDSVLKAEKGTLEAKMLSAQAEVKFYQNEVVKRETLFSKDAVSETELRKSQFELEKAQAAEKMVSAELNTIQAKLQRKVLVAPISGVLAQKHADAGSVMMPGNNKVVRLIQCDEAFAEIELGERMYPVVQRGEIADIKVDALPGKTFRGKVDLICPEIDKKTRTFKVRIRIPNKDLLLRPGMFVQAEIKVPQGDSPIIIPSRSLLIKDAQTNAVFVIKDGMALRRSVLLGGVSGEKAQIARGLSPGDLLVTDGTDRISDLAEVTVDSVEEQKSEK
jgi:membrane fusion protein, multidrug efflux system